MSGLLALLDDVAVLARIAAVQVDDIAAQAAKTSAKVAGTVLDDAVKAGSKAAGVVIDDAAVTPKYVQGLPAAREIPIVAKIARGSIFNKLVILLPAALLLNVFAPWLMTPLLMLGGCYLCFEGAEKILHVFVHHEEDKDEPKNLDAAHLEEQRIAGAIKTDFILSAEIMTIALSQIESDRWWVEGVVLAIVAIGITVLVYGSVAILVKADDIGLKISQVGRFEATRAFGRGLVKAMPTVMMWISIIGTAAMLWVGGSIVIHGLEVLGWGTLGHVVHDIAAAIAGFVPFAQGFMGWLAKATLDGIFGLALGFAIIPIVTKVIGPIVQMFTRKGASS